jgi:uncharacterized repeat protein (TIGR01451 family)
MNYYLLILIFLFLPIWEIWQHLNHQHNNRSTLIKWGLIAVSTACLTIGLNHLTSPLVILILASIVGSCSIPQRGRCANGVIHVWSSPKPLMPKRFQQWLWSLVRLVSVPAAILLWLLPALPDLVKVSCTAIVCCYWLAVLMRRWIRLRAWVMTGIILSTLLGSIHLESIFSAPALAASENILAGAYVIDMGQATQTVANGLKPYGLVYELVVKKAIPVKWAIDPTKTREGVDFTANGKPYKGGSFIITAEYATDAASTIAAWKAQGVVVDGPLASFDAPIYATITNFPNAVLDFQNGSIAQAYFTNAGIPASTTGTFGSFNTYRFGYPSSLTPCDDVFVLPHGDPNWANHQNLIPFVQNRGFVWGACHGVSVLERIDDPGDADTLPDMNFLSHVPPAIQDSKSLKLFTSQAPPTAGPYQYANSSATSLPYGYGSTNLWAYPIMQFLGKIDAATQNGSEQIYTPDVGAQWRNETAIAVYDDNNLDPIVLPNRGTPPPITQVKSAKMAFGPAFGNASNGLVMYEAGHSHAKGTLPDNIAAQRAFLNFMLLSGVVRGVSVNVNIPTNITAGSTVNLANSNNGAPAVVAAGGNGLFSYRWYSSCGGTFSNATAANPTYTAPATGGVCTLRVVVNDGCNRRSFGSDTTVIDPAPVPPKPVDLEVFKTDGQTQVLTDNNLGTIETVTYTISVKNNGSNSINTFTLNDIAKVTHSGTDDTDLPFPSGLTISPTSITTLSSGAVNTTSKGSMSGTTWTATTGVPLATGQVLSFNVTGSLNTTSAINISDPIGSADLDLLINTASVSVPSGYIDTNSANNSSTDTNEIRSQIIDLSVTKIDDLAVNNDLTQTFKGKFISYKITVKNEGNVSIAGAQLRDYTYNGDTLGTVWTGTTPANQPSDGYDTTNPTTAFLAGTNTVYGRRENSTFKADFNVTNVSKGSAPTTWQGDGTTGNWTGLNLAPGESATLTLTGLVDKDQTRSYLANVIRVEPLNAANTTLTDSNTTNNIYYDVNKLVTIPGTTLDLSVTKSHTPLAPIPGGPIIYKVILQNLSTVDAAVANVNLIDAVPSSITVTNWFCAVTDSGKDSGNTSCGTPSSGATNNIGGITGLKLSKSDTNGDLTTLTYTVTGMVNTNAVGAIVNTATVAVAASQTDQQLANNTASDSFNIPAYKIGLTKTDGLTQVKAGDSITYTITVTNSGIDNSIAQVKVIDDLAQGYLLNPVYTPGSGIYNSATGDWTGLNVAPSQTATLTIAGTVASNTPTGTGTLVNTATLTVPSGIVLLNSSGTVVTSLVATDSDTVNPSADLAITKTDNQTSAIPGTPTGYAITVTNNGPSPLTSLTVTDTVPAAILNPVFSASSGTYAAGAWTGLNLAAGQSITLSLEGTIDPTATGILSNTATVAPPIGAIDPNNTNNSATDTTTLSPTADLAITKTDGKATVNPGEAIVYTVRVTNNGPSTVTGATVTDTVPAAITGVTWNCTISTGTGSCGVPTGSGNALNTAVNLNSGATATYTISSTSNTAANPSIITNTATVTAPVGVTDPTSSNNSSTDTTIVPNPSGNVDLQVLKQAPAKAFPGGPITYKLIVKNNGPDPVNNVTLTETLPSAIAQDDATLFFSSPDGSYNRVTGEWTFFSPLAAGQQATLILDSEVTATAASGTITNTVMVSPPAGFTDSILSNNTAQAQTLIAGPSAPAEVLLVKRVTAINGDRLKNPNDPTKPLNTVLDNPATINDNHPNWPNNHLIGAYDPGKTKPNDEIEYTIYFMNANGADAKNVKICDRIIGRQAFLKNGYGSNQDIQFKLGTGSLLDFTRLNDANDRAQFYDTGVAPPASCNLPALPNATKDNGTLAIDITGSGSTVQPNLTAIPGATGQGTLNSYGFFRFKTKVNPFVNP